MPLAAKAMGVTVKQLRKMMEQGQLLAKDFLPKFRKEIEKLTGSIDTTNTTMFQFTRLTNAFTEFKASIFSGGFGQALAKFAGMWANILEDIKPVTVILGTILKGAIIGIIGPITLLVSLFVDAVYILKDVKDWMVKTWGKESVDDLMKVLKLTVTLITAFWTFNKVIKLVTKSWIMLRGAILAATAASSMASKKGLMGKAKEAVTSTLTKPKSPAGLAVAGTIAVGAGLASLLDEDTMKSIKDISKLSTHVSFMDVLKDPFGNKFKKQEVEVKVTADDSKFSQAIKAEITGALDDQNQQLLNNSFE